MLSSCSQQRVECVCLLNWCGTTNCYCDAHLGMSVFCVWLILHLISAPRARVFIVDARACARVCSQARSIKRVPAIKTSRWCCWLAGRLVAVARCAHVSVWSWDENADCFVRRTGETRRCYRLRLRLMMRRPLLLLVRVRWSSRDQVRPLCMCPRVQWELPVPVSAGWD